MPYPQPVQVIDFVVNINGQNVNLQEIPANANIADDVKTGMLITGSRDEMNTEVLTMKQKSEDVLKSVEYHQNFLRVCDQMLATLNPEFAAKQQQEQEISALKGQMSNMDKNMQEMSRNMADLIAQNQKLMEQLGVAETSKTLYFRNLILYILYPFLVFEVYVRLHCKHLCGRKMPFQCVFHRVECCDVFQFKF